jgi:hypothetical protein
VQVECRICGSENPVGAHFCSVCGTRLSDAVEATGHGLHEAHGRHEAARGPNRGPAVVAVAVAVLIAVVAGVLYADARGDLRSAQADLASARAEADELNSVLSDAREELRATEEGLMESRQELRERIRSFHTSSRCLVRMFDAWYDTLDLSLTATGFALARAVQSGVCQVPRAAYERSA